MKKVIKKTKAKNKKERDDCFETSNIKFGKLDIVLQSYNTVPTIESFYNTIPEISTEKKTSVHFESSKPHTDTTIGTKKLSIFPCSSNPKLIENVESTTNVPIKNEPEIFCWWCRVTPMCISNACFLPLKHNELKNTYSKHGFFCSWECTKAYNFEHHDIKTGQRSYLIQKICRSLYGINRTRQIKYSRHWRELKKFGGTLEDEAFFDKNTRTTLSLRGITRQSIK